MSEEHYFSNILQKKNWQAEKDLAWKIKKKKIKNQTYVLDRHDCAPRD